MSPVPLDALPVEALVALLPAPPVDDGADADAAEDAAEMPADIADDAGGIPEERSAEEDTPPDHDDDDDDGAVTDVPAEDALDAPRDVPMDADDGTALETAVLEGPDDEPTPGPASRVASNTQVPAGHACCAGQSAAVLHVRGAHVPSMQNWSRGHWELELHASVGSPEEPDVVHDAVIIHVTVKATHVIGRRRRNSMPLLRRAASAGMQSGAVKHHLLGTLQRGLRSTPSRA